MYAYYERQHVLPTYGALDTEEQLAAHEHHRRRLFTDKLLLPPQVFDGARLIEFGPDAGENSLVFAQWGAGCTLVEPNLKAHPAIRAYFDRFGLAGRLAALHPEPLQDFPLPSSAEEQFDIVDAEGFIYTVQPSSLWIEAFARLVRPGGLVVLFYMETFGSLLELVWKVVQARYRALTGDDAFDAARTVFAAKWASIPHKRSIESWAMDVLENPFVRLPYFLEAQDLCRSMSAAGFRLYSSWPRYDGGLDVHWFKRELTAEEQLGHELDFIARSRLSHLFGRKHFAGAELPYAEADLVRLIADVDALIDDYDAQRVARARATSRQLAEVVTSGALLSTPGETAATAETLAMLDELFDVLDDGSPDAIVTFCNSAPAFIDAWGTPSHFAVFRRAAAD